MKITWSPLAIERVQEISDYIEIDSPSSAIQFIEDIFSSVNRLEKFPESGRRLPEFPHSIYREILLESFRVIYRTEKEQILILTVKHQRQLLPIEDIDENPKT